MLPKCFVLLIATVYKRNTLIYKYLCLQSVSWQEPDFLFLEK